MSALSPVTYPWGMVYLFHCPGCGHGHGFFVRNDGQHPSWSFNGDMEHPTFTPSLLNTSVRRCHLFLTDGVLHYCGDCDHTLAGQQIPLAPAPDEDSW